jgi:serine phosphatase RsbU (regulator of sigma subunit)
VIWSLVITAACGILSLERISPTMKHSIKTKLILTLASLIAFALVLGGGIIIAQNTEQLRQEIYLDSLSFAELTNDRLITAFEQFYVSDNFLQFRKVANPMLTEIVDIDDLEIIGKSGELYYESETEQDVAYLGLEREQEYSIERAREIKPSLFFDNGEVVYVQKDDLSLWQAVDTQGDPVEFPGGEVINIIYPHSNARIGIVYHLTYEALTDRIIQMAWSIGLVILLSILFVSGFAVYFANKLVRPIEELEAGVVEIGKGKLGAQVKVVSDDEIGVLARNFNAMSKTLKKNTKELLEKEKLTKELDIARSMQQNMLPDKAPKLKGLEISGSLRPATQIGGDIYDFLQADENGAYIFIADVTGHGVPAGMVANITHSSLYSFSSVFKKTDEIMKSMNKIVHAKTQPNMFATALLAYWNEKTRALNFCNAGHEEALLYRAKTKQVELVGKGGMALGMTANADKILQEQSLKMESGDVMVFYTDGIPEAWKNKKTNLGMEAFTELASEVISTAKSARSIREGIIARVDLFRQDYPQQDDITIVVMRAK